MMDIAIAAVFVLCTAVGWRRGLFRSLAELAAMVLALVLASQIAAAAAPLVIDRALRPATHGAIEEQVQELLREGVPDAAPIQELERVVEAIPNAFIRRQAREVLDGLGDAAAAALAPTQDQLEKVGKDIADAVLDSVVHRLVHSVLCVVSFMVLNFLLRLAVRLLSVTMRLPVLKQFNEAGGALLGMVKGTVLVCLAVWLLGRTGAVTAEMAQGSVLFGAIAQWTGAFGGSLTV